MTRRLTSPLVPGESKRERRLRLYSEYDARRYGAERTRRPPTKARPAVPEPERTDRMRMLHGPSEVDAVHAQTAGAVSIWSGAAPNIPIRPRFKTDTPEF